VSLPAKNKTLRQLLNESGYTPTALAPDDLTIWDEEQFIVKIVKEWLTQKRNNPPSELVKPSEITMWIYAYNKLLEELL
jgi:hypothetical protein